MDRGTPLRGGRNERRAEHPRQWRGMQCKRAAHLYRRQIAGNLFPAYRRNREEHVRRWPFLRDRRGLRYRKDDFGNPDRSGTCGGRVRLGRDVARPIAWVISIWSWAGRIPGTVEAGKVTHSRYRDPGRELHLRGRLNRKRFVRQDQAAIGRARLAAGRLAIMGTGSKLRSSTMCRWRFQAISQTTVCMALHRNLGDCENACRRSS